VFGRVVGRRNDDAISQKLLPTAVMHKNGMRNDWSRSHAIVTLDDGPDVIGCQDLQCCSLSRAGERVSILAQVERTVRAFHSPEVTDRLGYRQNVSLGESAAQR